jgi:pimeloyl-ACP methyl ester carboxylesterase
MAIVTATTWTQTLTISALSPVVTPITIAGVRCLVAPCTAASKSPQQSQQSPPLIIIPGMAQSLAMYEAHAASISRSRSCLVVEPLGLGMMGATFGDFVNVSLPAQAAAVITCAESAFSDSSVFSIAGFSLGGRIGMAAACLYPDSIEFLHLTGVATERSDSGKIALTAWKDLLVNDNLRGFAWSAVQTTYSAPFLLKHQDRLVDWIDTLVNSQTVEGLTAILEQTHPEAVSDPWSVPSMANSLRARAVPIKGGLLIGADDSIVSVAACQQLAEALQWAEPGVVPDAGHAVPMEAPRVWRQHLLDSLKLKDVNA